MGFAQCKLLLPTARVSTAAPGDDLAGRLPGEGTDDTRASRPGVRAALRRARGPAFASDHSQSFVPELREGSHTACAKWLPGWPLSAAPVRDLAPQRRLLPFIPLPPSPPEEGEGICSPMSVRSPEHPHSCSCLSV